MKNKNEFLELEPQLKESFHAQKAMKLFKEGYNCAQATFLAFEDIYHLDHKTALLLSSSFGGGMGRLREVCGAVSAMFMVIGLLYGYDSPSAYEEKAELYTRVQELARQFEIYTGTIICRELLGEKSGKDHPEPEKRSAKYYEVRPCEQLVGIAAYILETYLKEQGICPNNKKD